MPVLDASGYNPCFPFISGHVQTVFPNLFRRVERVFYERQRVVTPDADFFDLDISAVGSRRIALVAHGLEGNSHRSYVRGMVRALNRAGWDAAAFNFRGCSGEANRNLRFYHSGDSDDLRTAVEHILQTAAYRCVSLIGFSLGANAVLKYLGEEAECVNPAMAAAVAFSVPCDLRSSVLQMGIPANRIYMTRFLKLLREKIRGKMQLFPGQIDDAGYDSIRTFKEFDDRYAPFYGFADAEDYYKKASSKPLLRHIAVPTLVVSAADDPFLPGECYPVEEALGNPSLYLEIPKHGGHVGFVAFGTDGLYWSESRAVEFLREHAA